MPHPEPTSLRAIMEGAGTLTAGERRIVQAILTDYPFAALVPIQDLARRAGVSAPTVTRFVAKIGCAGYQDFQRQLIGELKEREFSPVDLKRGDEEKGRDHFLPGYLARVGSLLEQTAESVSREQFDELCRLLADPRRAIHLIGGRVTDSLAQLLSTHLRQIRGGVRHLPADPEQWPDIVLGLRRGDVLVVFDVRRYDPRLVELARLAMMRRGSTVVALTDKWLSPVTVHARMSFALPTDVGTPWDSYAALIAFVEAVISRVAELDWPGTSQRIAEADELRASFGAKPGGR